MRIVSLVPSQTETVFALGLGDQIVGRTRFCRLPEEAKAIAHVGGTKNPRLEAIVKLRPDIVLMDADENREEDAEFLRRHGIPLFVSLPKDINDTIQMISDLGDTLGESQRAAALCEEIRVEMAKIHASRRFATLLLIWPRPYITVSVQTYVYNVARFFGFDCVLAEHNDRYPRLTDEDIQRSDAEAILLPTDPYPFQEKHTAQIKASFPNLPAVVKNRLLIVDGTYLTWHGFATLRALREFPIALREAGCFQ